MDKKKRIEYLDYVKAICIFGVMMEHRLLRLSGTGAFLMPSFFIISGFTFSINSNKSFKEYALKRVKRLLIPYWIMMVIYAVIEVARASLLGYGGVNILIPALIPAIYGSSKNFPCIGAFGRYVYEIMSYKPQTEGLIDMILPSNCFLWFLPAMFSANIVFYFVIKNKRKEWWYNVLAILGLVGLASMETIPGVVQFPYGLGRGFLGAAFMLIGHMFRESRFLEDSNLVWQIVGMVIAVPISVLSVIYNYECMGFVRSDYGTHMITDVFISFVCGVAFSYVVIMICKSVNKIAIKPLQNFLLLVGSNSMGFYLWHILIYFIGDLFMIFVVKEPMTPDTLFFLECFYSKCLVYRWMILIIAFAFLTAVAYFRKENNIKSRYGLF